jgi:hypothetical protein
VVGVGSVAGGVVGVGPGVVGGVGGVSGVVGGVCDIAAPASASRTSAVLLRRRKRLLRIHI